MMSALNRLHKTVEVLTLLICVMVGALQAETTVPFDPSRGLVEVKVVLDGRVKGKFGIDTGADKLYINRSFVERHGFAYAENTKRRQSTGVDGSSAIAFVDVLSLKIGGEDLGRQRGTVVDIGKLSDNPQSAPPDGLIGCDILRRYLVTVDYPAHELTLQTDRPDFLSGRAYSEFAFRQRNHLILVDVSFDNHTTRPMILDYCATHTSINQSLAGELGLEAKLGIIQRLGRISLSNAVSGKDVEIENTPVIVTDLSHYKQSLPRSDFAGILGGTFLSHLKITIDYPRMRIYVHD